MSMRPISLERLLATAAADVLPHGLRVSIPASWIVPGEDRLSYASAIRLAECCREHHWQNDLADLAPGLDSIVVRCDANFSNPIIVGSRIDLHYAITRIGKRSYDCTIAFSAVNGCTPDCLAVVVLTNVFYDPDLRCAIDPPSQVAEALRGLLRKEAGQ